MPDYHTFVFDSVERRFVGRFEDMYKAETKEGFDSWHQDDLGSRFDAITIMRLMGDQTFAHIVDIGCGKGTLTNALSSSSQAVIGLDVSPTAVDIAQRRYPALEFRVVDTNDATQLDAVLESTLTGKSNSTLVVLSQVLSYLSNWKEVLAVVARHASHLIVALYLPKDPIGFVKTPQDLQDQISTYAEISEWITSDDKMQHIVFANVLNRT